MSPYKFPTSRKPAAVKATPMRLTDVRGAEPAEAMGLIQGRTPDSIQEWWIAKALDKLRLDYYYQFRVFEARGVRGELVVDFLVLVAPRSVALQYYGGYWHRDELVNQNRLDLQRLEAEFGRVVVLTDADGESYETIYAAVRRELGV